MREVGTPWPMCPMKPVCWPLVRRPAMKLAEIIDAFRRVDETVQSEQAGDPVGRTPACRVRGSGSRACADRGRHGARHAALNIIVRDKLEGVHRLHVARPA